ncbi:MAG: NAD(P)H-hydrate epimerase [Henriciella sp.]|nr:NAD(P)H-hydrate epimerase [Henriciella sp.]
MYLAEQKVIENGVPGFELMRRAGHAVGDILNANYPMGDVAVLCGPGGNGGDGFVAAARLHELGRRVSVYSLVAINALAGDAAHAAALWSGPIASLDTFEESGDGVVLDALFGGGLSRALSGRPAELAAQIECPIVAVDVPSGLDGASARPLGVCFSADLTITFAALRPAHVLSPGRSKCGNVHVVDIGVPVPDTVQIFEGQVPVPRGAVILEDENALADALQTLDIAPINRIGALQALSQFYASPIVLKSPEYMIASPQGSVRVKTSNWHMNTGLS